MAAPLPAANGRFAFFSENRIDRRSMETHQAAEDSL
jgi:hypothetical protein